MASSSRRSTNFLATIGAASLLFVGVSLCKFIIVLKHHTNFAAAFLASPPRDAFDGKVFWITGASSGYGKALALHLCSSHKNVNIILSSRSKYALERVATECHEKGRGAKAKVLMVDLADLPSLQSKAEEALSLFDGHVDVLVNNGGLTTRSFARNSDFAVDTHVANVDFLSYVALTKALIPSWDDKRPLIINTASVAGKFGVPVRTAYCAAKFAILGWFDAFRMEQDVMGQPVDILNVVLGSTRTNVARNAITASPNEKFGESDQNIEGGLDPDFVVERVLASAYVGQKELWIAPKKELLALYLNQYVPETAYKLMMKSAAKQYAVQKNDKKSQPNDKNDGDL